MWSRKRVRKIVRILMGSRCYFDLDVRERCRLIRYLLKSHQAADEDL